MIVFYLQGFDVLKILVLEQLAAHVVPELHQRLAKDLSPETTLPFSPSNALSDTAARYLQGWSNSQASTAFT